MKCPSCNKDVPWESNPFRPFCSERCKLIDLGRWVSEEYRVPGQEISQEDLGEDRDRDNKDEPVN